MKILLPVHLLSLSATAQTPSVPSPEIPLKGAVLAAPSDKRDGVTVYGYNDARKFVLLRKGTNDLICLAEDPAQKGFSASCYYKTWTRSWRGAGR